MPRTYIFPFMSTTDNVPTAPPNPGWNFCHTVEVRFRDIDMFLHLNNAAYLTYAESARVAYYRSLTGIPDPRDFDMTVARAEVDFRVPVFFGQTIRVYTRASRIGTKSWTLEHEFRESATNEIVATVSTVVVHFDHETGKSKALPQNVIELIEGHEGRSLRS